MSDTLRDHLFKEAEKYGWKCVADTFNDSSVDFEKCTPFGRDFSFFVDGDDIACEVREYAHNFDADNYIKEWIDADEAGVVGVPDPETLRQEAEYIQHKINKLAKVLEEAEENFWNTVYAAEMKKMEESK